MRMNVASGSVLDIELRPPICPRRPSYSPSLSPICPSSRISFSFWRRAFFSSLVPGAGLAQSDCRSCSHISVSCAGVNSTDSSRAAFSWAMASSIWLSSSRIFCSSFSRFFTTVFFHTKVYLFALDSIFVPSMYSTSRLIKPRSARISTNCVNTLSISSLTRLRKLLIVLWSGWS